MFRWLLIQLVCSRESFELVQFKKNQPWAFGEGDKVNLPGAHGAEIVRAFCFLDEVCSTVSLNSVLEVLTRLCSIKWF